MDDTRFQISNAPKFTVANRMPSATMFRGTRMAALIKRQPEMNYPEKVGIATASDLGEEIVPDGENAEHRGPPERVVHVPVLVSHFDVGVLKRAVCADVGQRDNIQSADRGHDDEANCPKHRRAEGDHVE